MKIDFGLTAKDIAGIVDILKNESGVEKAYLFGSRAKGTFSRGSDVDLALTGKGLNFSAIRHISYLLNEETAMPYHFDVINYHSIREPALTEHIDRVGVIIYDRSDLAD